MKKINFNSNWIYYEKGKKMNAEPINLPHDAMIHRDRIPGLKNGSFTGFYPSGDYIYEKIIYGASEYIDKTLILEFEGVYMDSTVSLNDEIIGGHVYGYSHFFVDLTNKLVIGEENKITVEVHCSQVPNSRWYPGNGIYRPVSLHVGEKEHIKIDGVSITTKSIEPPTIEIDIETSIKENVQIETEITYKGVAVAKSTDQHANILIPDAKLWDDENPTLYEANITLKIKGEVMDNVSVKFGVRTIDWNPSEGLKINNKSVKLRGGCVHHDNGVLGACAFEAAEYRKVRIMKEAGFNAIRSAHYPISKHMLNACDELGMYIMDEAFDTWRESNGLYGYTLDFNEVWRDDLSKMIIKDRNHPSVIMYSIGNEISDTAWPEGAELAHEMTDLCHNLDSTRPVTVCPNLFMNLMSHKGLKLSLGSGKEPQKEDVTDPLSVDADTKMGGSAMINVLMATGPFLMKLLMKPKGTEKASGHVFSKVDIAGYNYAEQVYEGHHKIVPNRIIVGSETHPNKIYHNWSLVKKLPYVIGDFMWTGWDYLGEVGVGIIDYGKSSGAYIKPYPAVSAYTGVIDLTGHRELNSHIAAIVWDLEEKPYIAVQPVNRYGEKKIYSHYRYTDAVHCWTWPGYEGSKAIIEVYSKGVMIELFQDGKTLGRKKLKECLAKYKSVYKPGILEAVSYDVDGSEIERSILKTAKKETLLSVTTDKQTLKPNGEDLAFISVELTDSEGILKLFEEKNIQFKIKGAGYLQGIGSANPRADEAYTGSNFTTYQGRMQAVVRSGFETGNIIVTVSAEGISEKQVIINVQQN